MESFMENKKFCLYTEEEREQLLMHWWFYYGKSLITLAEIEQFRELVKKDSMLMRDAAMLSFMMGYSNEAIIKAMREGNVEEYLGAVRKISASNQYKEIEREVEVSFLNEVVSTYNAPKPSVLMSQEDIVAQLLEIVGRNDAILTSENVHRLYRKCLITDQEINGDEPTVDFVIGEGIHQLGLFSAQRLEENKGEIIALVDELPKFDEGISFLAMCDDKNGRQWGEHVTMDFLVQLGIASGVMSYVLPRSDWDNLPGGMPYLIRNIEKDNEKIEGKKPAEYKKVLEDFKKNNS